ncbi:MAG: hypothetical protein K9N35_06215, partial [Candidatus Marinimicrobia bacterium]|nr:hypothetical protein [Candidatus Neomarinimicrobiota bacterium]
MRLGVKTDGKRVKASRLPTALLFILSLIATATAATSISITAQSDISGSMGVNTVDNGMLSFTLTMAGNGGDITLDSVTVDLTGTAVDADIAAVKVYKDAG